MKTFFWLSLMVIAISFGGCVPDCTLNCVDDVRFQLVGFDSTEVDSVVVKAFVQNGKFDKEVKSLLFRYPASSYGYYNDTFYVGEAGGPAISDTAFDWEIIVPSVNRTYKITELNFIGDVTQQVQRGRSGDDCTYATENKSCSRELANYKLNGIPGAIYKGIYGNKYINMVK